MFISIYYKFVTAVTLFHFWLYMIHFQIYNYLLNKINKTKEEFQMY